MILSRSHAIIANRRNAMRITAILIAVLISALAPHPLHAERVRASKVPVATCKEFAGSIFKPCICSSKVPNTIKYRPSLKECGGKAAAILFGEYANSFSVVLRDNQNRDRVPASGYHGCSQAETDAGLNKCSAFKCQVVLKTSSSSVGSGSQQICCFGESGRSPILAGASRMTLKIRDVPGSTFDPLLRVCLNKFNPNRPLN